MPNSFGLIVTEEIFNSLCNVLVGWGFHLSALSKLLLLACIEFFQLVLVKLVVADQLCSGVSFRSTLPGSSAFNSVLSPSYYKCLAMLKVTPLLNVGEFLLLRRYTFFVAAQSAKRLPLLSLNTFLHSGNLELKFCWTIIVLLLED